MFSTIPLTVQTSLPRISIVFAFKETSQKFHEDQEVKNEVTNWFRMKEAEFCDIRLQKLLSTPNKCLDKDGD